MRTKYVFCDPQMSELTADLVEEQATTVQAAEVLDVQSSERMRLEKEVGDLQVCLFRLLTVVAFIVVEIIFNFLVSSFWVYEFCTGYVFIFCYKQHDMNRYGPLQFLRHMSRATGFD